MPGLVLSVFVSLPSGDRWEVPHREFADQPAAERFAKRVCLALRCQKYGPTWWKTPERFLELRADLKRAGIRRGECAVVVARRTTAGDDAPNGWREVVKIPVASQEQRSRA